MLKVKGGDQVHVMCPSGALISGCLGDFQVISGDGPLPMAIFELLEYIVNEVNEITSQ